MPLTLPTIDNRTFDDIVAEARTRIPRYTPEWTDQNDSDPGMTLVQLMAWMTELLIYRMGKVPELNYIKFLQLIGVELRPAEPARAEITFPVVAGHTAPFVIVPMRTQVAAESDEGELVVFETEQALVALTARLAAVQSFDGFSYRPLTADNDDVTLNFQPFGPLAGVGSALLLGFAYDDAFPAQIQLNLAAWIPEDAAGPTAVSCGLDATPIFTSVRLIWEFWSGSEWAPLSLLKDETLSLTRTGHVHLKTPAAGKMQRAVIGAVPDSLYWIRARLASGSYQRVPKLRAIRTNTIAAVQAETIREEVLGGSDGSPNQTFQLANAPVLNGSLVLEVDEGEGYRPWTVVNDFLGSTPDDLHFVLNRTSGEVRFGDEENGRIPVANVENPTASVLARAYRVGGGARGNVGAGTLTSLLGSVEGIDANGILNLLPAFGGEDEETLQEAIKRAPTVLRTRCRAVTSEDFQALAAEVPGVKRAYALPLSHPEFPGTPIPGVITVIVVPDGDARNPTPGEGLLRSVCAYLDQRRLLTTELYVVKPIYRKVEIRGEVIARNDADLAEVKEAIVQRLLDYFHPLIGGEDGSGWPFGGDLFYSRIYQQVFSVPGVERIEKLIIMLDGDEHEECRNVSVPAGELLYSTRHDVAVNYAFDD